MRERLSGSLLGWVFILRWQGERLGVGAKHYDSVGAEHTWDVGELVVQNLAQVFHISGPDAHESVHVPG